MEHEFKINGFDPQQWGVNFLKGTYRSLVVPPSKKSSPLNKSWPDENGTDVDKSSNFYESKQVELPIIISGENEIEVLLKYDQFVNDVLISGSDIVLDVNFFNRRYTLRYERTSNIEWKGSIVLFTLHLVDDYPTTIITIN